MPIALDHAGAFLFGLDDAILLGLYQGDTAPAGGGEVPDGGDGGGTGQVITEGWVVVGSVGRPDAPRAQLGVPGEATFACAVGSTVELRSDWLHDGVHVAPVDVTLRILTPGNDEADPVSVWTATTNPSAGVFVVRLVVHEQGRYHYWWQSEGGVVGAAQGWWDVVTSPFTWS